MVPKKKSKNAFILFVNDWRKRHANNLSWEASISKAGLDWDKMSAEERLPYKMEAINNQQHKVTTKSSSPPATATKQPLSKKEEEEMQAKRHTDRIVNDSVERIELETHHYCFIMVNYFAKTTNGDMYQPAELAMAEFSLQEGISRLYHKLINPGPSVYGSDYETQIHVKETHRLPIPPNAIGDANLEELYKEILEFLRRENEFRPVFTTKEQIPIVSSALKYLNGDNHELKIYSIEYLFYVLKRASCQISGTALPKSIYETSSRFERDSYEHELHISCDFHEKHELSKYCAKSCVTRWGFMFAEYMCNDLAISMLPSRHKPPDAHELITNGKIEEQKKDDDNVQIKTECPDESLAEDLWNDLNHLTDILEGGIGGETFDVTIKTEIDDKEDGQQNDVATPPPAPPISLGEMHDELALFTRRMKTNSEEEPKEKNSKETNMISKSKPNHQISRHDRGQSRSSRNRSRSNRRKEEKTRSKSRERKPHPSGTSISRNRKASKSKSRDRNPHHRESSSSRRRKETKSKSRERKQHQRENCRSRHYRRSPTPKRGSIRKDYVSRIDKRRISRSKSRELISYRRRSFSRESSVNLNNRHRRSRSRSNLRFNRFIRRSRSRSKSISRYRYRSPSLSPIRTSLHRRRAPLRERSNSPIRNSSIIDDVNPLLPQSTHSASFTNAPYQLPIHSAASANPIATPVDSSYQMPPGDAMQHTHTTYSTQYYQTNPMPSTTGGRVVYKQPLLPPHYDLRHRLGPPAQPPPHPRYLNEHDLRHRIRGRPEFYGSYGPPYANYEDCYQNPQPYMAGPNHYDNYHPLPPDVYY